MNVFLGPNGCGKTTVLESAYLLGTVRSFRTTKLREVIQIGKENGSIEGVGGERKDQFRVELRPRGRTLTKNHETVSGIIPYTQSFTMVALAPEHQEIIMGSGEERRRYIDFTLYTLDPAYLEIAQRYRRTLRQKQALLRADLPYPTYQDEVAPWNETLIVLGEEIRKRRREIVKELRPQVENYYQKLATQDETVGLVYQESGEALVDELTTNQENEHRAKRALVGPQRDDLEITLRGESARAIASQGEKASLLLALKLAELEKVEEARGEKAVLILDDIGVTLDRARRKELFALLSTSPHQALISTPEEEIARVANEAGALTLSRLADRSPAGFSIAWRGAA